MCPQRRRSPFPGFSANVVAVIKGVIFGPVWARFGRFERGGKERIILRRNLKGFYSYSSAFRKICSRRQDNHAILDFSGYAHGYLLP